jgi:FlaA1/EpsC-like NDP-sugar epimerase
VDIARAIGPDCELKITGIRPGEKLHEVMIPPDEARHTVEYDDHYVVTPPRHEWNEEDYPVAPGGRPCPEDFCYSSDTNTRWLDVEELRELLGLAPARV